MALKLIDARRSGFPHDGQFGRVHLVFDRDIDANPLRLSILKLLGREYLGRSFPPKANWTPARSHFFEAPLVSRGDGKTVFSLGPEVTTFIPDESTLEIASEDNAVKEVAVWSGVSVDFTWPGQPPQPEKPATPPISAIATTPIAPPMAEPPVGFNPPQTPTSEPAREPKPTSTSPAPPPPPAPRSRMWMLIPVAVPLLAGAGYWASQNRDLLCDRFGLFCDAELVTYREAQSCAAPRTCGALECVADYRRRFANGPHRAEIERIAQTKGVACEDPVEKDVYQRAEACAATKPANCGAAECVTEYRSRFPFGPHKADIDRIAQTKGATCPDLEKEAYDRAASCAGPLRCGADHCLTEYRRDYPNGLYRSLIEQTATQKGANCPLPAATPTPVVTPTEPQLPPFVPLPPGAETGIRNCNARNLEPIAQMICRDADMARANSELQKAFDAKVISMNDASDLRKDERAWIERRDRDCGVPPSGNWEINDLRKLKNCVIDHTRARINELR